MGFKSILGSKKCLPVMFVLTLFGFNQQASASGHNGYVPEETCGFWGAFSCAARNHSNRYNTKYPVVLVHGVSGFDNIMGFIDYFHDIPESLEGGSARVYVPAISSWDDAYVRGEQLLDYIQNTVLPDSGASKVNLIGFSLGGPTVRYVAGVAPSIVASATTVHAVNYGSGFADWGLDTFPQGSAGNTLVTDLISSLSDITNALSGNSGNENDVLDAILFMSSDGANAFNATFSDGMPTSYCGEGASQVNGVHYFSWGGTDHITNVLDVSDYFLAATGNVGYWNGDENDGLVAKCSMHWGDVIADHYRANHFDGVNHLFGLTSIFHNPVSVYENHASRLRDMGL